MRRTTASFEIPGTPVAKGRPRFTRFGKAFTPEKTVNYENLVKMAWQNSGSEKLNGPLACQIRAFFPIPKSTSKKRTEQMRDGLIRHTKKPDCDNIAKSILDALNGIAFDDDSQICSLNVSKMYSDVPRAIVELWETEKHD